MIQNLECGLPTCPRDRQGSRVHQALESSGNNPSLKFLVATVYPLHRTCKFCACACKVRCTIVLIGGCPMGPQSAGQEGLRSSGGAGVTLDAVPVRGLAAGTTANSRCVPIIICLKTSRRWAQPSPDLRVSSPLLHPGLPCISS